MHPDKIKNVINLDPEERYWYSIREIVKSEQVWAVGTSESWVTFVDEEGDEIFPVWPHKEVAEICIFEELKVEGYSIQSIAYDEFKEFCIPDMADDDILFGVFYDSKKQALAVGGDDLLIDLMDEE